MRQAASAQPGSRWGQGEQTTRQMKTTVGEKCPAGNKYQPEGRFQTIHLRDGEFTRNQALRRKGCAAGDGGAAHSRTERGNTNTTSAKNTILHWRTRGNLFIHASCLSSHARRAAAPAVSQARGPPGRALGEICEDWRGQGVLRQRPCPLHVLKRIEPAVQLTAAPTAASPSWGRTS